MITLIWIGFTQSLFIAILMFGKKDSTLPDRVLSGFLFLMAIEFLTCGIDYLIFNQPILSSSFLLFNPALFIYISALTRPHFRLQYRQLLHLLPFIGFELASYIIKEPLSLDTYFDRDEQFWFRIVFGIANLISWLVYNPLSLWLVHMHRMHLRNEKSSIDANENLGWVLVVSIFYVVYCILAVVMAVLIFTGTINPLSLHFYNYAALLAMIYAMGFYGLRQQKLPTDTLSDRPPYQYSSLSEETKQLISKQIIQYIESEKPWLQSDFNMDSFSGALHIPKYQLTEVLNTTIGQNFFQFINHYRVEAVKTMLTDPSNNYSIEAIGYECGFASKSAFYSVFKKITRQTPVEYRNNPMLNTKINKS
jgi:AraC-like DNA-binding protein